MDDTFNIYKCKKCGQKNPQLLDFAYQNNKGVVYCSPCFKVPVDYYVHEKLAALKRAEAEQERTKELEIHTEDYSSLWEPYYNDGS